MQQDVELAKAAEDSLEYFSHTLNIGDTIFTKSNYGLIQDINFNPQHPDYLSHTNDIGMEVVVNFKSLDGTYNEVARTAIGVRENLLYQYPHQLNEIGVKLRLDEKAFDNYFSTEDQLKYDFFTVAQGESFTYAGETYQLQGFDKEINNKNYIPEENDIAIQAQLVRVSDGKILKPIYVIRDTKPSNIKDYEITSGIHARIIKIDPVNEQFSFTMAQDKRETTDIVLDVAENVGRTDFIVLEALMFPFISLFWLGTCLCLFGFFFGLYHRRREKISSQ